MNFDLAGVGTAVQDTLLIADGYPQEDTKIRAAGILQQGGGPCTTALAAAAKLGLRCAYAGAVGDDPAGRFIREDLERWGVDTGCLLHRQGQRSTQSFVLLNRERATRTCVACGASTRELMPEELPKDMITRAGALHLDGRSLDAALAAAKLARSAGVPVSLDAGRVYPGIEALLPLTDWLIPSEGFVSEYTGERDVQAGARLLYERYRPRVLIVTQGSRGGFLWDGERAVRYPAFPVEAVDTNGAGDVFHGAWLAAKLRGMRDGEAARFASAAAAIKCCGMGARIHAPRWEQVEAFLAERAL